MPILLIVVAVALAIGGALYYKSSSEGVPSTGSETSDDTTSTSGIANMLTNAETAAEAMSNGLGGAAPAATPTNTPTTDTTTAAASTYANDSYTMSGAYVSPAGRETVTVSVTLTNDVVTSATFAGDATNPTSVRNQERFAAGYTSLVVGKDIDSVELGVVNGSSLTGIGFNDAIAKIKTEARI